MQHWKKWHFFDLIFKLKSLSLLKLYKAVLTSYASLSFVCRGSVSHIFYNMCTVVCNCLSLGSLVFATDAKLYKNVTNMIYNYDTLL